MQRARSPSPLKVHIVRHAPAVPRGTPGYVDAYRPLTSDGRERMVRVAKLFAAKKQALDILLTSPLVRAVQTAEILAVETGFEGPVDVEEHLAPGGDPNALIARLAVLGIKARGIALVGHEPDLSDLAARLLGKDIIPAGMKKGAIMVVDFLGLKERPRARFQAMLLPKKPRWVTSIDEL